MAVASAPRPPELFRDDADLETEPPSDCECTPVADGDPNDMIAKMEALNRANEMDTRSVSGGTTSGSRRSIDDSECDQNTPGGSNQPDEDEELDLWTIWGELVKNWDSEFKKRQAYVRDLVRKGIPCHFRTIAWQLLSNAQSATVHEQYAEYLRTQSPHEKVIARDISRTYPEHEFFKDNGRGQQSLFNVIKAYSLHDREVGYCQGSAFIVGLLLLQMPEEEAFAVFCRLMEDYRLRELYKPAMTELGLCMFQLECLVQEQMPDLFMHFNNMGFDTSMYASSWFLTLFTTQLPLELANRIMDVFMSEGMEVVFRLAMAILQRSRFELLQLDMEGMLRYFQRDVAEKFDNDHDLLVSTAYQVKLNAKKMKKLEKDYLSKRTKEQEEAVELRRLRTENRLLRQRVEYLEQESEALADRLIKGQVNLAQEAENCISVSHQLHKLRDINNDAHKRLEEAYETIRELSSNSRDNVTEASIQVDDNSMIEHIHALQQELLETHVREADNENTIRDLKQRIQELEAANKRLKETPPDHCVASLQEQLISVKMQEAEASLSLKEMRQRLADIETQWTKYISSRSAPQIGEPGPEIPEQPAETPSKRFSLLDMMQKGHSQTDNQAGVKELEDQLMGVRIREADTLAELKEMRQKVMELETQNHVCTNQLRRQDDDLKRLRLEHQETIEKERDALKHVQEEQNKMVDTESRLKEQSVMARLKEAEYMQTIADLRNRIAELDSKRVERWTTAQLTGDFDDSDLVTPTTPTSLLSQSFTSADAMSVSSEMDLGAVLAEMTVNVPPELVADLAKRRSSALNGEESTDSGVATLNGNC